ncbi:MAG: radical SAM protein [Chloroflexi bacterium]|nr:radical SAM protein [Chloroflexota bacterium]
MKVGLIQAIDIHSDVENRYPPLGFAYLAGYARKYLDLGNNIFFRLTAEQLIDEKPDIVGITSVSHNFGRAIKHAKKLKEALGIPVIVGGTHVSYMPAYMPTCFDVAVLGEGEETFAELLSIYRRDHELTPENLCNVQGIAYRNGDKVVLTPARPLISPLDKIPFPARDLFEDHWGKHFKEDMHMFTARGCPYKCIFCASTQFWDRTRFVSPDYAVAEIQHLVDTFKVQRLNLYDDLFIANKKWFRETSQKIQDAGLHKRVTFYCSVRANMVDEEICAELRRMNVDAIGFGAESGNDEVLKYLGKKAATVEVNQRAIDIAHAAGLRVNCSFIIGSPMEGEPQLWDTYNFISSNVGKVEAVDVYPLNAYPGTEVWNEAVARGLVRNDMAEDEWDSLAQDPATFNIDTYRLFNPNLTKAQFHLYFQLFQELSNRSRATTALKTADREYQRLGEHAHHLWLSLQNEQQARARAEAETQALRDQVAALRQLVQGYENGKLMKTIAWVKQTADKLVVTAANRNDHATWNRNRYSRRNRQAHRHGHQNGPNSHVNGASGHNGHNGANGHVNGHDHTNGNGGHGHGLESTSATVSAVAVNGGHEPKPVTSGTKPPIDRVRPC